VTFEPHAGRLQRLPTGQQIPAEDATPAVRVHVAVGAVLVPEPGAVEHGAVALVVAADPGVVVLVERREHGAIVVAESVAAGVARVAGHLQSVVVRLAHDAERAVLGVVPAATAPLQVEPVNNNYFTFTYLPSQQLKYTAGSYNKNTITFAKRAALDNCLEKNIYARIT